MGAALYIDVLLIFLWKFLCRLVLRVKSSSWSRTTATVLNACASRVTTPGCPVVEISYTYSNRKEQWEDKSFIPFLFIGSARHFAQAFPSKIPMIVRVDPQEPGRSIYFGGDRHG